MEQHILYFRKNLQKVREALRMLTPDKDEPSHIVLESMLQTQVNKYGPYVKQFEQIMVLYFNSRNENPNDKQVVEKHIANFEQKLDTIVTISKTSGKKPSDLFKEKLSEIVELIDGLVLFASY